MAKKNTRTGKSSSNMIAAIMEHQLSSESTNVENKINKIESEIQSDSDIQEVNELNTENTFLAEKQMNIHTSVQYDDTCDTKEEVIKLSKENIELKDKIAEYINTIEKLKHENESLQKAYDECLMKISELSFEVANLTASLNEVGTNNTLLNAESTNYNQKTIQDITSKSVLYTYNNGYTSWN